MATVLRGWALAAQGKEDDGIAQMRQGLVAHQAMGPGNQRPYFLLLLAEAYGKVGQPEEGLTVLGEALAIVDNIGGRNWEAELHRHKGELLLIQQGQKVGEAEECFRQALDIARRQQAKSLELRAAMSLSRLLGTGGKAGRGPKTTSGDLRLVHRGIRHRGPQRGQGLVGRTGMKMENGMGSKHLYVVCPTCSRNV